MEYKSLNVSAFGEKELINRIINKNNMNSNLTFKNYLGDDAAVLNINTNHLIATSDMQIQSRHFPKQMSHFQMGFKVVTVNVSDIAAMGGEPIGFLLSMAIPKMLKLSDFDEIVDGVISACNYYNLPLIGGDTNESDEIILSGTALGKVNKNKQLLKSGFKNGDLVAISGKLGLAALGFELLNEFNKTEDDLINLAISKALNPRSKIQEGQILKDFASSATDITDGLSEELYELFDADHLKHTSNHGIKIYESKLPIDENFIKLVNKINQNPLKLFFNVGEDFELLFTFDKSLVDDLSKLMDFYVIGEINDLNKIEIVYSNGDVETLSRKGYEHLK